MAYLLKFLLSFGESLSQGVIVKIFNYIRGTKSLHKNDHVFKETLKALKRTYNEFFRVYGQQFGPKKKSVLLWEDNVLLLINYIRMENKTLRPEDFVTADLLGSHPITKKALQFFIDTYETELKRDRELGDLLLRGEHIQQGDRLEEKIDDLRDIVKPPESIPPMLTGLPPRQARFIGRKRELKELEEKLETSGRVLLVNGMGGIGKTELCKEFFYSRCDNYQHAYSAQINCTAFAHLK